MPCVRAHCRESGVSGSDLNADSGPDSRTAHCHPIRVEGSGRAHPGYRGRWRSGRGL